MSISEPANPLYVYLQRPDSGEWIVVGRFRLTNKDGPGIFRYADSYREAGFTWSIDPVNLPFIQGEFQQRERYGGLHDVLRDAAPDAWGQMLIQREHGLSAGAGALRYLRLSSNSDRWGALAIGSAKAPNIAALATPKLPQLEAFTNEMLAIAASRPPSNAAIRKRLFATPSMGGARPKMTLQDGNDYWLVKPSVPTDTVDIALLEHVTQQWGRAAGLRFADTRHHALSGMRSAVRVLRFDRNGSRRSMAISAASLLQTAYPPTTAADTDRTSYPRLAEELQRIGAPIEDLHELFDRMLFNAIVGNDDDHPRNHAATYVHAEKRWRLSPAFDVVPNPDETPSRLFMQVSLGTSAITRQSLLADHARFGLPTMQAAETRIESFIVHVRKAYADVRSLLTEELQNVLQVRLDSNSQLLEKSGDS
ncbi:MAG: HipA domain-containing protein [Pseudomonadota bacterium]